MELVVYPTLFDHSAEKPFKCNMDGCKYSGKKEKDLYLHFERVHDSEVISCPDCSFTTTRPHELKRHSVRHTEGKIFKCEFCEKAYIARSSLIYHKTKEHYETRSKRYKCSICDYESHWRRGIVEHMATHGFGKYYCRVCDVSSPKLSKFLQHKKTKRHRKNRLEEGLDSSSSEGEDDEEKETIKEPEVEDVKFRVVKKDRKPKFSVLAPRRSKPTATIKTTKPYIKKKKTLELEDLYDEATLEEPCRATVEPSTLYCMTEYVRERWTLTQTQPLTGDEVEDVLYDCELCDYETDDVWDFLAHLRRLIPEPELSLHHNLYFSADFQFHQSTMPYLLKPTKFELQRNEQLPAKALQIEAEYKPQPQEELPGVQHQSEEPSTGKRRRKSRLPKINPNQDKPLPTKNLQTEITSTESKRKESRDTELESKEPPKGEENLEPRLPTTEPKREELLSAIALQIESIGAEYGPEESSNAELQSEEPPKTLGLSTRAEPKRKRQKTMSTRCKQPLQFEAAKKTPVSREELYEGVEVLRCTLETEEVAKGFGPKEKSITFEICPSPGLGSDVSPEMSFGAYSGVSPVYELETEDESLASASQPHESMSDKLQLQSTLGHEPGWNEVLEARAQSGELKVRPESQESTGIEAKSEESSNFEENMGNTMYKDYQLEHSLNFEQESEQPVADEPDPDRPLVIDYTSDNSIERDLNDLPSDFDL